MENRIIKKLNEFVDNYEDSMEYHNKHYHPEIEIAHMNNGKNDIDFDVCVLLVEKII